MLESAAKFLYSLNGEQIKNSQGKISVSIRVEKDILCSVISLYQLFVKSIILIDDRMLSKQIVI